MKETAWESAMRLIRDMDEDPDSVVRQASETVEFWKNHPFDGDPATLKIDEDEVKND